MVLNRLSEFAYSVVESENENKLWKLYLSLVANPYAEVTSFDEFKRKHSVQTADADIDLGATITDSFNLLRNFNPT